MSQNLYFQNCDFNPFAKFGNNFINIITLFSLEWGIL